MTGQQGHVRRDDAEPRGRTVAAELVADERPLQDVAVDGGEPQVGEHDDEMTVVA